MTAGPLVTVIIPTFNRAPYVGDALRSLIAQSYRALDILVVDDGSTDGTPTAVGAIGDPRIRMLRHDANCGVTAARNTGLRAARGRYIAWLDSDDLARPHRFARQIAFLEAHPEVAVVGSWAGKIAADGRRLKGVRRPATDGDTIRAWMLFRSSFQQSSLIGRADILAAYPYDPAYRVCEDVEVMLRIAADHAVANLPQVLVDRRLHPGQTVERERAATRERQATLSRAMLARLGMTFDDAELDRHVRLGRPRLDGLAVDAALLDWIEDWLMRLRAANRAAGLVVDDALALACGYFWLQACRAAAPTIGRPAALRAIKRAPGRGLVGRRGLAWVMRALLTASRR